VASLAALVLIVGCSAGGSRASLAAVKADSTSPAPGNASQPPTSPAPLPVVASSEPDPHQTQSDDTLRTTGLQLQVNSVKRDSTGIVTVTWTIINNGKGPVHTFNAFSDEVDGYYGLSVSNVQIVDQAQQLKYHPLIDTKMICYCSQGASADDNLTPGNKIALQDLYKPDPGVTKVDVEVAGFEPAKNVPVT
jgi:hypothetical protein